MPHADLIYCEKCGVETPRFGGQGTGCPDCYLEAVEAASKEAELAAELAAMIAADKAAMQDANPLYVCQWRPEEHCFLCGHCDRCNNG